MQYHKKVGTLSIYSLHVVGHATKSKDINTLLYMMRYKDHVNSRTIRRLLKWFVTPGVPIESALIANVRDRAKVILSSIEQENFGVERLVGIATKAAATLLDESTSDALNGKMCGVDFNDPEFVGFHTKQLCTMLVESPEKGKEVDHIISFLAKAKSADTFFN